MKIVIKPKNIYQLNKYLEMKADAFIFGIKDFSINPAPYFALNSPSGNSEDVTFFMCSRDSAGVIAQFVGQFDRNSTKEKPFPLS